MLDINVEDFAERAAGFHNLQPHVELLTREKIDCKSLADFMLFAYGADAVEQHRVWSQDAQMLSVPALQLVVIDHTPPETNAFSKLHLIAPRPSALYPSVLYDRSTARSYNPCPAYLGVRQRVNQGFHRWGYVVTPNAQPKKTAAQKWPGPLDDVPSLTTHSARTVPVNIRNNPWRNAPKHPMHVKGLMVQELISPSRDFPVIYLDKPRDLEVITPGYARTVHNILRNMVGQMKLNRRTQKVYNEGELTVVQRITKQILSFADTDYVTLAGSHENTPSLMTLEDLLEATKFSARWLESNKGFRVKLQQLGSSTEELNDL